ncbi:T9SS type A sorting domain-containing protein [Parabacteroides sp. OttesenSCG-928-N08]|nr:T9SS type A sorting domain-containing protein [Parabacteroides sp. OttesenSCG-928-N08]
MKKKYFEDVSRKLLMMILLIGGFLTVSAKPNYIFVYRALTAADVKYDDKSPETLFAFQETDEKAFFELWETQLDLSGVKLLANYDALKGHGDNTRVTSATTWMNIKTGFGYEVVSGDQMAYENTLKGSCALSFTSSEGGDWTDDNSNRHFAYFVVVKPDGSFEAKVKRIENAPITVINVEGVTKTVTVFEDVAFKIGTANVNTVGQLAAHIQKYLDAAIGLDGVKTTVTSIYAGDAADSQIFNTELKVLQASGEKVYGYNFTVNVANDPGVVLKFTKGNGGTNIISTPSWDFVTNKTIRVRNAVVTTERDVVTNEVPEGKELATFIGEENVTVEVIAKKIQKILQDRVDALDAFSATISDVEIGTLPNTWYPPTGVLSIARNYAYKFTITYTGSDEERALKYVHDLGGVVTIDEPLFVPEMAAGKTQTIVVDKSVPILAMPTLPIALGMSFTIDNGALVSPAALIPHVKDYVETQLGASPNLLDYATLEYVILNEDGKIKLSETDDFPLKVGTYSYGVIVTAKERVVFNIADKYDPSDTPFELSAGAHKTFKALGAITVTPKQIACDQKDGVDLEYIEFIKPDPKSVLFDILGTVKLPFTNGKTVKNLQDIHYRNMVDAINPNDFIVFDGEFPKNINSLLEPYGFDNDEVGVWLVPTVALMNYLEDNKVATIEDAFKAVGAIRLEGKELNVTDMGFYDLMLVLPEDEQVQFSSTTCNIIQGNPLYNVYNLNDPKFANYLDPLDDNTPRIWVSHFPLVVLPKVIETHTLPAFIPGNDNGMFFSTTTLDGAKADIKKKIYDSCEGVCDDEFIADVLFYVYNADTPTELGDLIDPATFEGFKSELQYSYSIVLDPRYTPMVDYGIDQILNPQLNVTLTFDQIISMIANENFNFGGQLEKDFANALESYLNNLSGSEIELSRYSSFKGEVGSPQVSPSKLYVNIPALAGLIQNGIYAENAIIYQYGLNNSIHVRQDATIKLRKYKVGAVGFDNEQMADIILRDIQMSLAGTKLTATVEVDEQTPSITNFLADYKVTITPTNEIGEITPEYFDTDNNSIVPGFVDPVTISGNVTGEPSPLTFKLKNWILFDLDEQFVAGTKIAVSLKIPVISEEFGMTAGELGESIKDELFNTITGFIVKEPKYVIFPDGFFFDKFEITQMLEDLIDIEIVDNTTGGEKAVYVYKADEYPQVGKEYGIRLSVNNKALYNRLFSDLTILLTEDYQQNPKGTMSIYRSLKIAKAKATLNLGAYVTDHFLGMTDDDIKAAVIENILADKDNERFIELALASGVKSVEEILTVTSLTDKGNDLYAYEVEVNEKVAEDVTVKESVKFRQNKEIKVRKITAEFDYDQIDVDWTITGNDVAAVWSAVLADNDKNAFGWFTQTANYTGAAYPVDQVIWNELFYRNRLTYILLPETAAIDADLALASGSMLDIKNYIAENVTEGKFQLALMQDFTDNQAARLYYLPTDQKLADIVVTAANVKLLLNNPAKEYTRDYKKPVRSDDDLFFGADAKAIGLVADVFSAELTCNVYKLFLEGTDIAYSVDATEGSYPVQLRADALDFVKPVVGVKYAFDFTDATIIVKKQTSMEFDYKKINATWSVGAGGFPAAPIFDYEHSDIIDTYGYNWFTVTTGTGSELNPALWTKLLQNGTLAWFLYEGDITNAVVYKAALTDIFAYLENNVTDGVYSLGLYDKHGISSEYYYIPVREELAEIIVTGKTVAVEFKETGYSKLYGLDVTGVTPALSMQSTEGAAVPNETIIDWITDVKGGFAADAALGTYTLGLSQEALDYANANAPVGYKYVFGTANKATLTVKQMTWGGQQTITVNGTREYGDDDSKIKVSFDYPVAGMAAVLDPIFEGIDLAKYVNTGSTIDGKTNAGTYTLHMFDQDKVLIALLANYDVKFKEGKLVITPAELTVTIKDVTREFGAANPTEFEIEYTGMKRNESPKKDIFTDNILPIAKTDATAKTRDNAPIYFANWDKISAKNYTLIPVTGTLYIAKIGRTIIWDQEDPLELEVGQTVTLSANVKLSVEGISYYPDVAFKLLNGNCPYLELGFNSNTEEYYITGKAATINSVDAVEVTAFCEGNNDNYAPAAEVTKKIVVIDGDGDITKPRFMVSGLNTVYNGEHKSICADIMDESGDTPKPVTTYDVWYEGYGTTVYPESKVGPKDVGTYQVTVIATLGGKDGKQNTYTYIAPNKLRVNPKPVTIIAQNFRIMYGDNLPDYKYAYTILGAPRDLDLGDDIPELVLGVTTTQTPAGTYKLAIEVDNDLYGSNYCFNLQDGELLIDKAPLTIVANDVTATYGDALKPLSYSLNGMKYGQGVADLLFEPRVSTTATATSNAGIYDIIVTGAEEAANYELEYVDGIYTINQASQFIVWNQDPATFDILDGETAVLAMPESNTGREVTLVSNAPEIATVELVDGEWVMTLISEGDVTITAELAGDDNYLAADPVAKDFIVKNTTGVVAIGDGQIKVYPTLFVSTINVLAPSAVSRVDVISYTGAIVKTVNNPTTNIDLSSLGSGDYLLKVTTVDGIVATAKVVKQ